MNRLLNEDYIKSHLTHSAKWCQGHGAVPDSTYLGGGLLYYTLVYALKPKLAVILGSGGGFVPRMVRQAQRDIDYGRTILVDADKPGWGEPDWLGEDSFFRLSFYDIDWWKLDTADAANEFHYRGSAINYLHIDADHSKALFDFNNYKGLMPKDSIITLHDTIDIRGPREAVEKIKESPYWEVVNLPIGAGIALARRIK